MPAKTGLSRILIYGQNLNSKSGKHVVNRLLTERELVVTVKRPPKPDTWQVAGTLNRIIGNPQLPIILDSFPLKLSSQVIRLPPINGEYLLEFTPADWLGNYTLEIWRFNMPLYSEPSSAITSGNATQTSVAASSAAAVDLLTANSNRKTFTIYNNSTGVLYVGFGVAPTANAFSARINPSVYYESPVNFTGVIKGLWTNNNGNAQVTEFS